MFFFILVVVVVVLAMPLYGCVKIVESIYTRNCVQGFRL